MTANSRRRAMGAQRLVRPGDNVNCRSEGSERTGEEACPFVHARVEPDTCHARRIKPAPNADGSTDVYLGPTTPSGKEGP